MLDKAKAAPAQQKGTPQPGSTVPITVTPLVEREEGHTPDGSDSGGARAAAEVVLIHLRRWRNWQTH